MEYLAFLKSLPVCGMLPYLLELDRCLSFKFSAFTFKCSYKMMVQAQTTQEETQRMTAVRKVYQKAIITPTHQVEQLWRDYENFENSVSRALVFF